MKIKIPCPICNEEFEYELDESLLPRDRPIASIAVPHKDHVIMVYVDREGHVRGVEETMIDPRLFGL